MFGFLIKLKLYIVPAFYHRNMSGSGTSLVHPVFEEGSWEIRIVTPPPHPLCKKSFPGGTVVKTWPASAGDTGDVGSIPGWERSLGEGNGNPFQYS